MVVAIGFLCFVITLSSEQTGPFGDPNLTQAVYKYMTTRHIAKSDMSQMRTFEDFGGSIASLEGIGALTELRGLYITENKLVDIRPVAALKNLDVLSLWGNQIRDIQPIAGLSELREVRLENNQIRSVDALTGLRKLRKLTLQGNPLEETAYAVDIPAIRKNNPGIVIYTDRGMNPAKSLATTLWVLRVIACLVLIIVLALAVSFVIRRTEGDNEQRSRGNER